MTLEASPTLRTEVFKTTYTYLTLNTDHPDVNDALESSTKVITNTVTAPQHYLDMILEPSEAPRPETNTYLSTRMLEKTFMEEGRTKIETISDTITQVSSLFRKLYYLISMLTMISCNFIFDLFVCLANCNRISTSATTDQCHNYLDCLGQY